MRSFSKSFLPNSHLSYKVIELEDDPKWLAKIYGDGGYTIYHLCTSIDKEFYKTATNGPQHFGDITYGLRIVYGSKTKKTKKQIKVPSCVRCKKEIPKGFLLEILLERF